jgi:hypothetical protein
MNKEDLKGKISEASYLVTQEHGTEAPFSGELLDTKEEGIFTCVCCGNELFPQIQNTIPVQDGQAFGMSLMNILLAKKLIKVME